MTEQDSYAVLEKVRSLSVGDSVRVYHNLPHQTDDSLEGVVSEVDGDRYPIIRLEDTGYSGSVYLEYDDYYTGGSPYNVRFLSDSVRDGASVGGIEVIDDGA